jgi:MFS family permease
MPANQKKGPSAAREAESVVVGVPAPEFQFMGFTGRWPATFRALRHRNFRLFWFGQMISLTGTWMQWAAQGWLIAILVQSQYHQENSSLHNGMIGVLGALPMTFLTLFAGTFADKYDRRRMLILTQTLLIFPALALGLLSLASVLRIWHIAVLAVITGVINSLDMPVRQAFVKDMAGQEDVPNAIALNSTVFNAARCVGPLIAGALMAHTRFGISGVFILNAISFLPVIWGLYLIRHVHVRHASANVDTVTHLREGFRYVAGNLTIRWLLALMAVYSTFGFSYAVLLPTFARQVLHLGALGYGSLLSSVGWGAIGGALLFAAVQQRVGKGRMMLAGGICCALGLMSFSLIRSYYFSLFFSLPLTGVGLVVSTACINSLIQQITPDHLRGRIVSMWAFIFAGFGPVGLAYAGMVGHFVSPAVAIFFGGLTCFAAVMYLAISAPWFYRQE